MKGFKAMNLFGVLFVRKGKTMRKVDLNHEDIHTHQMKELLYVPFYLLYSIEYLIRLLMCFKPHEAYRNISFEREAYRNQGNLQYLSNRKHYAWIKYIKY